MGMSYRKLVSYLKTLPLDVYESLGGDAIVESLSSITQSCDSGELNRLRSELQSLRTRIADAHAENCELDAKVTELTRLNVLLSGTVTESDKSRRRVVYKSR